MTIDVASLVFEIDSTQAVTARQRLEDLENVGAKVDASARRIKTATEQAGIGLDKVAAASGRATKAATEHATSQGVVEKATRQAEMAATRAAERETAAWKSLEAQLIKRNAAYRGDLAAQQMKDVERAAVAQERASASAATAAQRQAAAQEKAANEAAVAAERSAARQAAALAKIEAAVERRNVAFRADQALLAIKAETAASAELDRQIAFAVRGHEALTGVQGRAVGSTRAMTQATLNLGRQAADVGVQAAMLTNPLMILIMQGPQIADAFATAKSQGVGFSQVLKGLAVSMGLITISVPPVIAEAVALAASEQTAAAAALEVAVANRAAAATAVASARSNQVLAATAAEAAAAETALASATARQAVANQAATVAAAQLSAANEVVAATATQAAAAESVALAPLAAILAGIAATMALVFGSAALAARSLNEDNKNLVASLGLTQKQLDHLKDKGVNTAVTIGDVFKGTFNYIRDGIAPALAPVGKWFSDLFDTITTGAMAATKAVVGGFVGAFAAIKAVWADLPAVLGDVTARTANVVIGGIESMVNKAIGGVNKLVEAAKGAASLGVFGPAGAALASRVGTFGPVSFGRVGNENAGAADRALEVGLAAGKAAGDRAAKGVDKFFAGWGKSITEATADRLKKLAGDAGKAPKGAASPRDMTDERSAQLEQMIAQATADELQARLGLAREVADRAALERQIAEQQEAVKAAQLARQRANIEDDKGLSDEKKAELLKQMDIVASINARAAIYRGQLIDERAAADLAKEALASQQASRENQIDLLRAQADLAKSAYERASIEVDILKAQQEYEKATLRAVVAANDATAMQKADAQRRLTALDKIHALQLEQATEQTRLVYVIGEAADAASGFKNAIQRHDWARAFDEFQRTLSVVTKAIASGDWGAALMAGGSAAASLVGGKAGRAVGGGLGMAGAGLSLGAFAGGAGAATLGTLGLGAGAISSIAALAGPIGLAAGAIYAAVKLFNVGGKPTNAGAGFDLTTGAFSGNKRTSETEQAANGAADAILSAQDMLKASGIDLATTVRGLVIGTRDLSQIYLTNGQTLTSAVGDSAAAVDAAVRGILQGATYQSDAQKKLVESTLAAGKGLDELAQVLSAYEAAQKISGNIADEILRLTDPKAYDTQAVNRETEEQRKAAKAAADAGYITADQLTEINKQLATLQGLRLDEVAKQYGANDNAASNLQAATDAAKDALLDSYNAFAQAKQAEIAALRQSADALKAFRKDLDFGAIAGRDPLSQYSATKREFDRLNALSASDPERMANLQSVGQAFVEASRVASPTQLAFERDLNAVRRATEATQDSATQQADAAQAQLDAATAQLQQLGLLNATTLSMADALNAYLGAVQAQQNATAAASDASNDNSLDVAKYLAANSDLTQNWAAGGSLRGLGSTIEEAARAHYAITGAWEVSTGQRTRGYAAGGDHPGGLRMVGEEGPELEATGPSRIYSAKQTAAMLGGDTSRLEALIERQNEIISAQASELRAIRKSTDQTQNELKIMRGDGLWVRGEDPDEPVSTVAA